MRVLLELRDMSFCVLAAERHHGRSLRGEHGRLHQAADDVFIKQQICGKFPYVICDGRLWTSSSDCRGPPSPW